MVIRLKLFFAHVFPSISSVFTEQSQICVKECNTCHDRTGRLILVQERVERLPQQDRVIKICIDAGFLTTVDVDNTSRQKTLKNSHNLQSQWLVVTTLCQEMKNHLTRKVGFEGTPKLGPYLEVTICILQGKYGVEIRIESVNKDNYHSCVRIYHSVNTLVADLSNNKEDVNNEQETSEMRRTSFAILAQALKVRGLFSVFLHFHTVLSWPLLSMRRPLSKPSCTALLLVWQHDRVPACTQVKNGRCTDVVENSEVNMSRYLDTSTKTLMA